MRAYFLHDAIYFVHIIGGENEALAFGGSHANGYAFASWWMWPR